MQCAYKHGIVGMVLWACSLLSFIVLLVQLGLVGFSRVIRVSKVRAAIRVSIRIGVSLVLVSGWGQDFPTWSEWSYVGFLTCSHSLVSVALM